ncbi:MAG: hypothetical protein K5851_07040 [Lachnospiraceae bacterium]|nr:hypothetical protein [Lachnospiraceae bacterium]
MKNKILKAILSNIGLKIIALLAAIILWIVVVNIEDPDRSKFFTAKVTILNESVLTNNGKYYELKDDENTVTFRVTAKRSIIEKLSNSDFTATADLNFMSSENKVPVNIEANRYSSQIALSTRSIYINLEVGNTQSKRFSIKAETKGEPIDGVVVKNVYASPNVITVKGPDKIVSTIDTVKAVTDVTDIGKDITDAVVPVFLDKKGREVDTSKLTFSCDTVKVSVETASAKSVKISAETSGTLPEGYTLGSVTVSPETIEVAGDAKALNKLSEIVIPGSVIDLSNITKDMETTVDISSYLPEGIELVNQDEKDVKVKVKINSATTKSFDIPTANLTISGLGMGYTCEFLNPTISVAIKGLQENLAKLDATKITGKVDAQGLTTGTHHVTVVLTLGQEYTVDTITTEVKISENNN